VTLEELEAIIRSRKDASPDDSYSARLLNDAELTQRKIMEEAFEVCLELNRGSRAPDRIAEEAADLIYHLLAGLVAADVSVADVLVVLEGRRS